MQYPIGRVAQLMQARVAEAAHHREIGVQAPAFCYEYVGNLVFFACRTVFYRIDAVIPGCTASLPFSASASVECSPSTTRTPTFLA
jgi:hypothetical protein